MKVKGNTLVPIKMFINEKGWAKLLFAMGQGKKMNDKRDDLKEKDDRREMNRAMKVRNK